MSVSKTNIVLLIAVALTLATLALPALLPGKKLAILPHEGSTTYIFTLSPSTVDGGITANWLDQSANKWRCTVENPGLMYHCSYVLSTTGDAQRGLDFSGYSDLKLKIMYTGSARRVRVGLRTYDERFSSVEDANSAKYHFVVLLREDLNKEISIPLNDLAVAEWWVMQYNLSLPLARADLGNVISVTIELVDELDAGNHDLQVQEVTLVGKWIAEELLYIGIIVFWVVAVLVFVLVRILIPRRLSL